MALRPRIRAQGARVAPSDDLVALKRAATLPKAGMVPLAQSY